MSAKFPFKEHSQIKEQLITILNNIVLAFNLSCEKISEKLGDIRVLLNVNDISHTIDLKFNEIEDENGNPINLRYSAPKMICLNNFNLNHIINHVTNH